MCNVRIYETMKRTILRNIAIVSAIFIVAFSIMLITNYFQVRGFNPLQTEVVETLKQINDANAENDELKEQIRMLDLMARRAYFVRMDHLMAGVYILLFMVVVFLVSLRFYFAKEKDIPGKQIDPIDEWVIKTNARKYVKWVAAGLVGASLLFVFLTSPYLKERKEKQAEQSNQIESSELMDDMETPEQTEDIAMIPDEAQNTDTEPSETTAAKESATTTESVVAASEEKPTEVEVPKVTHNGFRGNNSNAISNAKNIPSKWDLNSGENIAWKSEIPKHGYNSPAINGNRVFITGADDQARELYCYDLVSGELLWTLAATNIPGSPAQMPKTTSDTGLAASTVATNGKQVCAIFASGDLICADMEGNRVWAKNLGVPDNHYGYASSLLVFGNSLIIQYDNRNSSQLISLDIATGNQRWKKARTDKITWSSPIIASVNNKPQLILMGNPGITAYNPSNGDQYWRVDGMSGEVAASPCAAGGVVFGASEYAALIAINAETGEELWKADDYLPEVSSPVATKDYVYVATSYGVLACYDAKTGELKHSHELDTEFYSSPVIVEGKLYLFSNNGEAYIFSTNEDFKMLNSFDTGEKTFATPAFTDGRIVVRTENSLYCVMKKG